MRSNIMLKLPENAAESVKRNLTIAPIRMLHRPINTDQFIRDKEKATDLLLGLRLFLQNHTSN